MSENYSFRSQMNGFHRGDVIAFLQKLMGENAALREKAEKLEQTAASQQARIAALEEALAAAEKKQKENADRVDTAKLGAAMYDARRFSDLLIGEATDQSGEMFDHAAASAQESGEQVRGLAAHVSALTDRLLETLNAVENDLAGLGTDLQGFHDTVTGNKAQFMQRFSAETSDKFAQITAREAEKEDA